MSDKEFGYDDFLSVFTWRYGSEEMRKLFSELRYRALWRKIWVLLAEAQSRYGLVSSEELEDLESKADERYIDLKRAHEIEKEIGHDVMAEIRAYAEQCPKGGGKIHLGATSMDIEDNADVLRIKDALNIILTRLVNCLDSYSKKIMEYKDLVCMGWTHLQPAEPTTLGYRLANYAQDIVFDIRLVEFLLKDFVKGKGIKGAVGTSASFKRLLEGIGRPMDMEEYVMSRLGLEATFITTQTYPRKLDYLVLSTLACIAQSVHKFAFDLRLLQSPNFGELSEPIREAQVGSTAMPFKRNPVRAERMCSLARYISTLPIVAFTNAANSLLERTLDDSANRRIIIPEAFLALDECLLIYNRILSDLRVYPFMIRKNLERYGPFAGTEAILMKLVERGEDRQKMHERIRSHAFRAWEEVMKGNKNPLAELLKGDEVISSKLSEKEIDDLLDPTAHVGDAVERCERFVKDIIEPIVMRYRDRLKERYEGPRF
ncbi:MAG: adenylosuccinate lyase [Nitrososphaerales archaeon]|nr:adenylosuccinate lyase [Nitrososphaerales archaeon]